MLTSSLLQRILSKMASFTFPPTQLEFNSVFGMRVLLLARRLGRKDRSIGRKRLRKWWRLSKASRWSVQKIRFSRVRYHQLRFVQFLSVPGSIPTTQVLSTESTQYSRDITYIMWIYSCHYSAVPCKAMDLWNMANY